MFEQLASHPKIIVTGPQRSGTNICARMIAHDIGHTFLAEQAVGINRLIKLMECLEHPKPVVIHGPAFSRYVHCLKGAFVVVMLRDTQDIYRSQERIRWYGGEDELARYRGSWIWDDIRGAFRALLKDPDRAVAPIKYWFWHHIQKPRLPGSYLEVEYESLASHPMWVPKELRVDFVAHQTSLDWDPY